MRSRPILISLTLFQLVCTGVRAQCSTFSSWIAAPITAGSLNATGVIPGDDTVVVRHTGSYSSGRPNWWNGNYTFNGKNFSSLAISRGSSFGSGNKTTFKLTIPLDSNHVHIRVSDIRGDGLNAEHQRVQGWLNGVAVAATFTDAVNGAFITGGNVINGASSTTSTIQSAMRAHFNGAVDSITVTATNFSDFVIVELMAACDLLLPDAGTLLQGRAEAEGNLLWCNTPVMGYRSQALQHSQDGRDWSDLHVFSAGDVVRHIDQKPNPGRNLYRLRLERPDGWLSYSNQVTLGTALAEARWTTYPNPCSEQVSLSGPGMPIEVLCLAIDGRILRSWHPPGMNPVLNTAGLPAGMLLLRAQYRDGSIGMMRILHR